MDRSDADVRGVKKGIALRACHAMPGTDIPYGAAFPLPRYAMPGTETAYAAVCLRLPYAKSGTEIAYAYGRPTRSPVLR
eukprot:1782492-Rhodomonas_salina.1